MLETREENLLLKLTCFNWNSLDYERLKVKRETTERNKFREIELYCFIT